MKTVKLIITLLLIFIALSGECQETVFTLLKNDLKLADQYFEEKKFKDALGLYLNVAKKNPGIKDIYLRIARSYNSLKQYDKAVAAYERHEKEGKALSLEDTYYYAEAQAGILNYDKAVQSYQTYLSRVPDDQLIVKKIWRLNNIQYLYEDSLHYAVRALPVNSEFGDLCAVPYQQGIVFMSNRKAVKVVGQLDATMQTPFYRIYHSKTFHDTTSTKDSLIYGIPFLFSKELNRRFHAGPLAFYDRDQKMVFTSTGIKSGVGGTRTLQLYFAEKRQGEWKTTIAFPYNNAEHSISDPSISRDGKVLFFSSNMKGGFGGKDIYKSEYQNGQWSKPVNMGDVINTVYDEVFPYLHNNTLYFSSNGHAGLGGLDLFKVEMNAKDFDEAENLGYPLNSSYDDFGIAIDSLHTHGYFTSNRIKGGYNDDLYEFDMDLQTYPLQISGLIKFKEHSWSDSLELKIMPHAKVYLMDNVRNISVCETSSDADGNFSITIPYFSKYKIRVIGEDNDENIVSLEIPKHKTSDTQHEIVVVKDIFKSP